MDNLARLHVHDSTTTDAATVLGVEGSEVLLATERGERRAARATSCLVQPMAGDEVLVVTLADGRLFVLAVLSRAEGNEAVELRVEGPLRVAARTLDLDAERGTMRFGTLALLAETVLAHADSARVAVKAVDTFYDRLSQTVKSCFRTVEETDQLRAGRLDYRTEKEMLLRAENVLAGARKLVKLDGEQIHIG